MQIGISITSSYASAMPREGARRVLERVAAARDAGLDHLFFGDHHVTPTPYYQNVPMLARALAEWDFDGDQRPFGALFLLPLWHPVLLAEQVGTLAALASGRFILQCALGAGARQFAAFGVSQRARVRDFERSLTILRALWAGEAVAEDGPGAVVCPGISPRPEEPVEIWIGASAAPAVARAARLGDGWLADPAMDPERSARALAEYGSACAGQGVALGHASIRKDVLVAATAVDARRRLDEVLRGGYRGFAEAALIHGDVEQVTEQLRGYQHAGYDSVIIRCMETDQACALETIQRMGEVRARLAP